MKKKKIKLVIPLDLLTKVCKANEPTETLEETIERYIRKGMKLEGVLP